MITANDTDHSDPYQMHLWQPLWIHDRWHLFMLKAMPVIPPHVEYSLTESGKDLEPVITEMVKWSLKYNQNRQ